MPAENVFSNVEREREWERRSRLGNVAKLRTPSATVGYIQQTCGECGDQYEELVQVRNEGRRRRYRLQRRAQYVMRDLRRVNRKGEEVPYRVESCLWSLGYRHDGVVVRKTDQGAGYVGLQICGSVWHCPVCAARIANERRRDIQAGIMAAQKMGYRSILATLTARHDEHTDLEEQLEAMTQAYQAVWRGEPAKRLLSRYKVLGMIRNLEATHSKRNGWHPHIHVIIFQHESADFDEFADALRARWQHCAAKHGLTMNEHGFDATNATSRVAEYLAKWGHEPKWREADELARWHTKKGKARRGLDEHVTPWQLLDYADNGDEAAEELFREYALAYHGRRQISWSNGLRKTLGLGQELTDEEAAEKEMEEAKSLLEVHLSEDQWHAIRRFQEIDKETGEVFQRDRRVQLLEIVEKYDGPGIIERCREEFNFEPRVYDVVEKVSDQVGDPPDLEGQRVKTSYGPGIVVSQSYCEVLNRWRCSVMLDDSDEDGIRWRAFDPEELMNGESAG